MRRMRMPLHKGQTQSREGAVDWTPGALLASGDRPPSARAGPADRDRVRQGAAGCGTLTRARADLREPSIHRIIVRHSEFAVRVR
eukprot:6218865-Prymnesium_polylepis.1